jgi:hypothetical protein
MGRYSLLSSGWSENVSETISINANYSQPSLPFSKNVRLKAIWVTALLRRGNYRGFGALDLSWLGLGVVIFIIGILYSVQTWRFPEKELTHNQARRAKGDSSFMLVLGIVFIALGLYL